MITGFDLKNAIISGCNRLGNLKKIINDLNVFPVPDGDTGTNMYMTFSSAARLLEEVEITKDTGIDEVSKLAADTLLRNARGNSGVILSLIFRGFADGCKGKKYLDSISFANALRLGADAAYKAVLKPVEGTILTVCRMAAEGAKQTASEGADVKRVMDSALSEGEKEITVYSECPAIRILYTPLLISPAEDCRLFHCHAVSAPSHGVYHGRHWDHSV